ncbi:hypothetical protein HHL19_27265 [Streptomyces sp. R302]|uniref:hypothetical protein n=1 Tax=unclassified Streptomyces TaxID=2593676 RepID=UPI00145D270D|nr:MULTISPECIES: hypothetical protein [unclassified Streptomyces]NML52280.1 hypothetical protein [Streptomyces sp. R301]NML82254.1 hypothetical protein [Streptomyces sp. R302]
METVITLLAGAFLIALGTRLIHRLNAPHDVRTAAHRFGDPHPALSRPPTTATPGRRSESPAARPTGTWP